MNQHRTLDKASLPQLIAGCCQEQTQISSKRGCCFELFCCALELGDDQAWLAIQQQYYPLFTCWAVESLTAKADHFVVDERLAMEVDAPVRNQRQRHCRLLPRPLFCPDQPRRRSIDCPGGVGKEIDSSEIMAK